MACLEMQINESAISNLLNVEWFPSGPRFHPGPQNVTLSSGSSSGRQHKTSRFLKDSCMFLILDLWLDLFNHRSVSEHMSGEQLWLVQMCWLSVPKDAKWQRRRSWVRPGLALQWPAREALLTARHNVCWLHLTWAAALQVRLMRFWGTNNQLHVTRFFAVVYKLPVLILPLLTSFSWLLWCFDVCSSCFQAKGGVSDVKMWCRSIAPAPAEWRTLTP